MNYTTPNSRLCKSVSGKSILMLFIALFILPSVSAQTSTIPPKGQRLYEIFSTRIPSGAQWTKDEKFVRDGGYSPKAPNYIYVGASKSPAEITGLSVPIRENPGPGEYRYITFAWVKWGGNQIGMKFGTQPKSDNQPGKQYEYTYIAGKGDSQSQNLLTKGLSISPETAGNWTVITRDLWKDFGDFTLTGVSFLCPERRDAGFDEIFLAKSQDDIANAPKVLPSEIATPVPLDEDGNEMTLDETAEEETSDQPQGVQIDWAAQIKAGGFMMYPLYFLGLLALVIALQRLMVSCEGRLAPKKLRDEVNQCLVKNDLKGALAACNKYPSTLANSLRYIFEHPHAGREVVSQTAGDIAARDIRTHLMRIYPLSIISSLSPLIGLLGTVVGMIEAFGLVAMYGDEGGASILSDSISKALITTAAGLIIAVPAIALYFIIKNRITRLASLVEVEIENVITKLYLEDASTAVQPKEEEK